MSVARIKCALLSSFTLDQLPGLVNERAAAAGIECDWYVAPFNQYPQQILEENSALHAFRPSLIFVSVAVADLLPAVQSSEFGANHASCGKDFYRLMSALSNAFPSSRILINNFSASTPQIQPLVSMKGGGSRSAVTHELNALLLRLSEECENVYPLDVSSWLAMAGAARQDDRYFYLAKMRLSRDGLDRLADLYARAVLAQAGKRHKCIVVDLDNTIWGGVIGEDGMESIVLSDDGPGKAFYDFQTALLELSKTGILLAVCSKNDADLAMATIDRHPSMVLRSDDFAAIRINWDDKAANLRSIAQELNLGLDSILFLDDSEHERQQVRFGIPEITVPDLPIDPSELPGFVAGLPMLDAFHVTQEDASRSRMYAQERVRVELKEGAASLEDFLQTLEIQVGVEVVDSSNISRCAQLIQRTNQFNLTTRRYTADELADMLRQEKLWGYVVSASDRIGNSGIVGCALVKRDTEGAFLDTFLLSCRVLGRGIETAFIAAIATRLAESGISTLAAEFISTSKNAVAMNFLSESGFEKSGDIWKAGTDPLGRLVPQWITLRN
jgi:FkbH-like protein